MTVKVIIHKEENGSYWAELPALKGCYSQGETLDEIQINIKEAIELYLSEDVNDSNLGHDDEVIEFVI